MSNPEIIVQRQLAAYNARDLEAFVACYSEDVRVFEGETLLSEGREAFRERYRALFSTFSFGADVSERLSQGDHCVDLEHWWRIDPETKTRKEGKILVCYSLQGEFIGLVRFLR